MLLVDNILHLPVLRKNIIGTKQNDHLNASWPIDQAKGFTKKELNYAFHFVTDKETRRFNKKISFRMNI